MYIRAKYPEVGNEYGGVNAGPQGFGSTYGGNQISNITQIVRTETLITEN